MGKVVDITDKLSFDGNPKLRIRGIEVEVNTDAPTMLKVMSVMGNDNPGPKEIVEMYNLMFGEEERKKIEDLKPSFADFVTLVQAAVSLITGEVNGQGE